MIWCEECEIVTGGEIRWDQLTLTRWRKFFDGDETEQLMEMGCPRCGRALWMVNPGSAVVILREARPMSPPYISVGLVTRTGSWVMLGCEEYV